MPTPRDTIKTKEDISRRAQEVSDLIKKEDKDLAKEKAAYCRKRGKH